MRTAFALEQSRFGLIFLGLGCGYCASGFFGGKLTHLLGLGNLLWTSSALVAVAMFAGGVAPGWPVIVGAAVVWGLGSGGIDAGLNAYAARHFSARHMNWLHACYSLGATLGPLVMTAMVVRQGNWRLGYTAVGGALGLMALLFLATRRGWTEPEATTPDATPDGPTGGPRQAVGIRAALGESLVRLQIVLYFLYGGLEFTVGQWCFTILTESRGVQAEFAGLLAGGYYGAIGVGRVAAGAVAHRIGLDRLVRLAMFTILVGAVLYGFAGEAAAGDLRLDFVGLLIVGLGLAPIFPSVMTRTPQRLGAEVATHAVGFQVSAAMLGAALLPGLAGMLAEQMGLEAVARFTLPAAVLLAGTHEWILLCAARRALGSNRP
jgi:fucose permease